MVLEQFLDSPKIKSHCSYILILSIVYVFIAYFIAFLFFKDNMSLAAVFTLTILLIPSLQKLITSEEKIERKEGLHHFFKNHKQIFKIYFFAFAGIMIGFILVAVMSGNAAIFGYQTDFLNAQHSIGMGTVNNFAAAEYAPKGSDVLGLFSHNLEVLLICFVLSIFYGAGAVFLVVFNASLFSAFLYSFMSTSSKYLASISFIHFVPEIAGFLLAGMAGAILSAAILNESISSKYFRNIMKNLVLMFIVGIALVLLAAVLEIFVSGAIIHSLISF